MRYRRGDRYLITSFPKDNGLLLDPGYGTGKNMLFPLYFMMALTNRGSLPCVPVKCFVLKSQDTRPGCHQLTMGLWSPQIGEFWIIWTLRALPEPSIQNSNFPAVSRKEGCEGRNMGFEPAPTIKKNADRMELHCGNLHQPLGWVRCQVLTHRSFRL